MGEIELKKGLLIVRFFIEKILFGPIRTQFSTYCNIWKRLKFVMASSVLLFRLMKCSGGIVFIVLLANILLRSIFNLSPNKVFIEATHFHFWQIEKQYVAHILNLKVHLWDAARRNAKDFVLYQFQFKRDELRSY